MKAKFYRYRLRPHLLCITACLTALFISACTVAEPRTSANTESRASTNSAPVKNENPEAPGGVTIPIEPNGPADTVRAFYKHLREKRFREAIFLTNLRPAIEGLTDDELKDFAVDFEALAGQVPAEVEINGEIVSGALATVTVNLPSEETGKNEVQTVRLKKDGEYWIIMTADDEAAERIKKEGKNYFFNLRIATHEEEARKMLERISKAQLAHSLQNGGVFTDVETLVKAGLLPDDIRTNESTGYNYSIELSSENRRYTASATPAIHGKSGRLSFLLKPDAKGISRVTSKDNGGKPLSK